MKIALLCLCPMNESELTPQYLFMVDSGAVFIKKIYSTCSASLMSSVLK